MTTAERPLAALPTTRADGKITDYPRGGLRFDFAVAFFSVWMILGLFQDGWAHNHGAVDENFLTPWHAILYSGIGLIGLLLAATQYRNVMRGHVWSKALPRGYLLSLIGVVAFFAAGGFDYIWHSIFGLEVSVDALISPPHLLLATSGVCIVAGPLRAAWSRPNAETKPGWRGLLPALLSMLVVLSIFTFFSAYANLFSVGRFLTYAPEGFEYLYDVTGIAYVLFPAALTVGAILFLLRRWRLPFGSITLLVFGNALLMTWLYWPDNSSYLPLIVAAPIAGLVGDVIMAKLHPSAEHRGALRLFAFILPFVLFGGALGGLVGTTGTLWNLYNWLGLTLFNSPATATGLYWNIHMWLGVTFIGGIIGLCLSYISVPPPLPEDA